MKQAEYQQIRPPSGLTKAEKNEFLRILELRQSIGRPLLPSEVDLAVDYAVTRLRLRDLRRMARRERAGPRFLSTDRAVGAAIEQSRRLSHDLGIARHGDAV
jgi:hypothetical protein